MSNMMSSENMFGRGNQVQNLIVYCAEVFSVRCSNRLALRPSLRYTYTKHTAVKGG